MKTLHLSVKGVYFHQIASGEKTEEFRLQTDYWRRRIAGHIYNQIEVTLGYPAAGDTARRMRFAWNGFRSTELLHPHFGDKPVMVFAIDVSKRITS